MAENFYMAKEEYDKALARGKRAFQIASAAGRYPYLTSLDELIRPEDSQGEIPIGLMEIPIELIAGTRTKARRDSFADNFMPLLDNKSEFAEKWMNLFNAQVTEGIRDPVQVYEYMQRFYVQEGNKRVSVLRYLNVPMISSQVTRILPRRTDDEQIKIYYEFTEFFKDVHLYGITFSGEGGYHKLTALCHQTMGTPWDDDSVMNLKSAFRTFSLQFQKLGGDALNLTAGDAFLIYLKVYGMDSLLHDYQYDVARRIKKIWGEYLLEESGVSIYFSEQPQLPRKTTLLQDFFRKPSRYSKEKPLQIAFLYDKAPEESRFIYGHELGRNYITEFFGGVVATGTYLGCSDREIFETSVQEAEKKGCQLIVSTSPAQMEDALRAAIHHPEIKFINCSVNLSHTAVRSYYGRMYEAKFIMGALAASLTGQDRLAYVCDYPIFGSLSGINAFACGAAMVRPGIRVKLFWSGIRESYFPEDIRAEGIEIVSGPELILPAEASREYGLYKNMSDGSVLNLAMPVFDWGKYYERIVRSILQDTWSDEEDGTTRAINYFWGMEAGVIDVILSEHLTNDSKKLVAGLTRSVVAGDFTPFDGAVFAQDGRLIKSDKEVFSSEEIVSMDFLCENVDGFIPSAKELNESGQRIIAFAGIRNEMKK